MGEGVEERNAYEKYDKEHGIREKFIEVLKEKFPDKLAEIYQRSGDRKAVIMEKVGPFAEGMLGERAKKQFDIVRALHSEGTEGSAEEGTQVSEGQDSGEDSVEGNGRSGHSSGWGKLLGQRAQKHIGAVQGMADSLKSGLSNEDEPATAKNSQPQQ